MHDHPPFRGRHSRLARRLRALHTDQTIKQCDVANNKLLKVSDRIVHQVRSAAFFNSSNSFCNLLMSVTYKRRTARQYTSRVEKYNVVTLDYGSTKQKQNMH